LQNGVTTARRRSLPTGGRHSGWLDNKGFEGGGEGEPGVNPTFSVTLSGGKNEGSDRTISYGKEKKRRTPVKRGRVTIKKSHAGGKTLWGLKNQSERGKVEWSKLYQVRKHRQRIVTKD